MGFLNIYKDLFMEKILYRMGDLTETMGMAESTIYKKIASGDFPEGTLISKKLRVWTHEELVAWKDKTLGINQQ